MINEFGYEDAATDHDDGGAKCSQIANALSDTMHTTASNDACLGLATLNTYNSAVARVRRAARGVGMVDHRRANANFAWVQQFIHQLAPHDMAGSVLANGNLSSNLAGEGDIRRALFATDLADC